MAVMSTKLGVNAFGATTTKAENVGASNVSALDKDKLGGENVGEVLNKIVDANWTDPAKKSPHDGKSQLG
ncbi:hypothetical protein [Bdellovibrio bacteriovorus]|uniref:hypothetical protein n=1 Tax=Bdellovibrio bacteriovorus TaxID=959 RepID=UPI0035A73AA9